MQLRKFITFWASALFIAAGTVSAKAGNWDGLYVSGSLGAGSVVHNLSIDDGGKEIFDFNGVGGEGVFLSVGGGYDMQFGRLVVGSFVDFDWSFIETRFNVPSVLDIAARQDYAFSVGGRAGLLINDGTLAYGLVGYTQSKFDAEVLGSENYDGIVVGGGLETKLSNSLWLRGEYRYSHSFDESLGTIGSLEFENKPSMHTASVGLVYRFGAR